MSRTFLSAEWRNLLMANYTIDPKILQPFLPCRTELDTFDGNHYVSLVGFLFKDVRLLGLPIPFHQTFEEVNVRFKADGEWRRGVVFMKEIVPKRMISFVANTVYGEKYATHAMRHQWKTEHDQLNVSYEWKVGAQWNYLRAGCAINASAISEGSAEEFITEHYWGYTHVHDRCTGVYEVRHPKWRVHKVNDYQVRCDTAVLYGPQFVEALAGEPASVFLAEGSPIQVMAGTKIYL